MTCTYEKLEMEAGISETAIRKPNFFKSDSPCLFEFHPCSIALASVWWSVSTWWRDEQLQHLQRQTQLDVTLFPVACMRSLPRKSVFLVWHRSYLWFCIQYTHENAERHTFHFTFSVTELVKKRGHADLCKCAVVHRNMYVQYYINWTAIWYIQYK